MRLAQYALDGVATSAQVAVWGPDRRLAADCVGATASTRFLLFSLSKAITAVAVAVLVDRRQVALDTRVAEVLPGFEANGKGVVTLEHVLSHTAGFADGPSDQWLDLDDFRDWGSAVRRMCAAQFKPSEFGKPVYHGLAYSVLGAVVESVSGQPFAKACAELVFDPLGMSSTTWGLPPNVEAARLVGPTASRWDRDVVRSGVVPAGNAWSTAWDVGRLFLMLRDKGAGLLRPKTVEEFLRPRAIQSGDAAAFALGFSVVVDPRPTGGTTSEPAVASFGQAGYSATIAFHDYAGDLTLVALTNHCTDVGRGRFDELYAKIYGNVSSEHSR